MSVPQIGEGYRGPEGHSGYLLRQAWRAFLGAMEAALREHGISGAQYGALSVLAREPGISSADLARASNTTPQAMTGVVAALERDGLVRRAPHPTHGRIITIELTAAGARRLEAANPVVRRLEAILEDGLSAGEVAAVKEWLAGAARRLADSGP
jgi:DNA-binding MarR family transcriptional regulator